VGRLGRVFGTSFIYATNFLSYLLYQKIGITRPCRPISGSTPRRTRRARESASRTGTTGGGLVFDSFAVLVGSAFGFRSALVVENHNSIPIHDIGMGTLLAILFPNNGRHHVAVLPVSFTSLRAALGSGLVSIS